MKINSETDLQAVAEQILKAANGITVRIAVLVPMAKGEARRTDWIYGQADISYEAEDILLGGKNPKSCENCGDLFPATDRRSQYCSASCRQSAYRARKKAEPVKEQYGAVTEVGWGF